MKHDVFDREFKFFKTEVFVRAQITTLTYLDWRCLYPPLTGFYGMSVAYTATI
ncbi:Uncharacterised protein [Prevotella nigrescens]|nr:Uncharacterised protein [Prevotella nigrescens]